ncbi:MAG TPA: stage II sporulation protein M [Tepidisphaeraceae bacterium]|jgi:uncharacterized membrane protein SpoIIM required for sporulation|nr:stage II sporulation protein M [Tepidisphaeraceae bacterium]
MDFNHFLSDRRPRWQRLADLLDRVDRAGLSSLGPHEADEFFSLYRLTSSDLSLIQTRTGNLNVTEYIEGLVARAYAQLQVPRKAGFFRAWWGILRHDFPAAVRANARALAVSAGTLIAGGVVGYVATFAAPSSATVFLPAEHLQESPSDRVARLEQSERDGTRGIASAGDHGAFTVYLFNNNIRVSVLAFALGLTFGVGTLIVLFYNGAMVGSLAAMYVMDGQATFFVAWVGPHGSVELPCVMIAGGAGLVLAALQLRRDRGSFRTRLRAARPQLVDLLVGTATLLVLAGIVEGGFSQINEPTIPYPFKIAVAAGLFGALVTYLFYLPVTPRAVREERAGPLARVGTRR